MRIIVNNCYRCLLIVLRQSQGETDGIASDTGIHRTCPGGAVRVVSAVALDPFSYVPFAPVTAGFWT